MYVTLSLIPAGFPFAPQKIITGAENLTDRKSNEVDHRGEAYSENFGMIGVGPVTLKF